MNLDDTVSRLSGILSSSKYNLPCKWDKINNLEGVRAIELTESGGLLVLQCHTWNTQNGVDVEIKVKAWSK